MFFQGMSTEFDATEREGTGCSRMLGFAMRCDPTKQMKVAISPILRFRARQQCRVFGPAFKLSSRLPSPEVAGRPLHHPSLALLDTATEPDGTTTFTIYIHVIGTVRYVTVPSHQITVTNLRQVTIL